jgi:hypothetical protein
VSGIETIIGSANDPGLRDDQTRVWVGKNYIEVDVALGVDDGAYLGDRLRLVFLNRRLDDTFHRLTMPAAALPSPDAALIQRTQVRQSCRAASACCLRYSRWSGAVESVQQLRRRGIDPFAFGISNGPFSQLDRIFGERRVPRIEVLPQRLVQLYRELKK